MTSSPSNDLRARLAALTPAQRALFKQRLEKRAAGASSARRTRPDPTQVPLSFAHERMWLLEHLDPTSLAYNRPQAYALDGPLNVGALRQAITDVVARHDSLRTAVTVIDGLPVARLDDVPIVEVPLTDLSGLSGPEQERRIHDAVALDARTPFDLTRAPLLRAQLLQLSACAHVLLLDIHHAASDGWSDSVFWSDLSALYNAHRAGAAPALPDLPWQYADYAYWQRHDTLHGPAAEQLRYWERQLAAPHATLFASWPRTPDNRDAAVTVRAHLTADLLARVRRLSEAEGVTVFMTLVTAFTALLHRYTHVEDVLVGTPTAGRSQPGTERMIGAFINTLVLRTQVDAEASFRDLLRQVRDTAAAAYAHQDVSFAAVVQAVNPSRDLNRNPLFQVMFNLRNLPPVAPDLQDLGVRRLPFEGGAGGLDLALDLVERDGGLDCSWAYAADLFDAPAIERLAAQYAELLRHAVSQPEAPIHSLRVATAAEIPAVLGGSRGERSQESPAGTIHHRFEQVAAERPEATAVWFDGQSLTYAALNAHANRLAHTLAAAGAGHGARVAICLPRGLALPAALLGVMKAGAAYVPIDPTYPDERRRFMLADSQAVAVITTPAGAAGFGADAPLHRPRRGRPDRRRGAHRRAGNPAAGAAADSAAYVLYTSGSTGRPKGVVVEHGAALSFILAARDLYQVSERRSLPAVHLDQLGRARRRVLHGVAGRRDRRAAHRADARLAAPVRRPVRRVARVDLHDLDGVLVRAGPGVGRSVPRPAGLHPAGDHRR